ncbi:MAG TPA: YkgJ family cysteine cluster protein [Candidatus Nanoarchaeia archaeon]|nr:YkgJ family cysteine cluster protein [Candidatus Nanoarchaeia archaeon]
MRFENCKKCRKDCCIFKNNLGFTFIGITDARNIKKIIKRDYDYFLDYTPLKKKTINTLKNCDPSLEGALRFSQLDNDRRILRLKTKNDGRCIFLNDSGRCNVYSLRPKVCKIYPFWALRLINGRIKIIGHDPLTNCPIITTAGNGQADVDKILSNKQILEIKRVFKCIEKEDLFYKRKKAILQRFIAKG